MSNSLLTKNSLVLPIKKDFNYRKCLMASQTTIKLLLRIYWHNNTSQN
jgi:hypothetical protein